jgi:hypothetical protein
MGGGDRGVGAARQRRALSTFALDPRPAALFNASK